MHPKVWFDKIHGGWWFRYWMPQDREWTEEGPFETLDECEAALARETDELLEELEYDV